jgi:hypothetical protein
MIADVFVIGSARIETSIKDLQEQGETKKMEVRKLLLIVPFSLSFFPFSVSPSFTGSPRKSARTSSIEINVSDESDFFLS